jgi:DNA-binding response OmpR family regulator
MNVLLVEDEDRIASFVERGLATRGFDVRRVARAHDVVPAVDDTTDVIVLDLGLPDGDGLDVLSDLRERGSTVPVLILSARGEVRDRVEGLELGADDYLTKPFAFDELLARVRARLRPQTAADATTVRFRDIELDLRTRRVTVGERPVDLAPREFALLETFLRNPGQVLSREQLLSRVWGYDFDPRSNVVEVCMRRLRKKLGPAAPIQTVRHAGYRVSAT